jgi:hypothetical protein
MAVAGGAANDESAVETGAARTDMCDRWGRSAGMAEIGANVLEWQSDK